MEQMLMKIDIWYQAMCSGLMFFINDPLMLARIRICLNMRATTSAKGDSTAWSGAVNAGATAYTHSTTNLRAGPHSQTTTNIMIPLMMAHKMAMGIPIKITNMW